jgi:hypothetical protein
MNTLETGMFHHKGPFGGPRWDVVFPGYLKERCDFFYKETLYVGGIREMCKKRLWKRATLSITAPMGNLKESSFTGDFERE